MSWIRGGALSLALLFTVLAVRPAAGQEVVSQQEALRLAFPGATSIDRKTAFLEPQQIEAAQRAAGREAEVRAGVVTYYVAKRGDQVLGAAYFDSHRVRTLPEVLMIVVTPRATIGRIEVLKFMEPPQYRPPAGWLRLFDDRKLDAGLSLRGEVANMTGATLTASAVTEAARRVLALHRVIDPFGARQASR